MGSVASEPPKKARVIKLDKYTLGPVLAETANSITFVGEDTISHTQVAVKVINEPSCDLSRRLLQNEVNLMQRVKHPQIITVLNIFDVSGRKIIVTPLARCVLSDMMRSDHRHPEPFVREVMKQLLAALQYLHSLGIIHRDVKPGNIFVMNEDRKQPQIVLADFGCAAELTHNFDCQLVGSPAFIAPEVYAGKNCMFMVVLTHRWNRSGYLVSRDGDVCTVDWDNAFLLGK
jgi:serine/threonine protein kinase